jgi:hypothetical protein
VRVKKKKTEQPKMDYLSVFPIAQQEAPTITVVQAQPLRFPDGCVQTDSFFHLSTDGTCAFDQAMV